MWVLSGREEGGSRCGCLMGRGEKGIRHGCLVGGGRGGVVCVCVPAGIQGPRVGAMQAVEKEGYAGRVSVHGQGECDRSG